MVELRQYTVTAYSGLYEIRQGPMATVTTAASPELAAELILGERLVRFGMVRDLRAKVSYEELGGVKTILLYRPPS